jgi:hypothetical protein
MLGLISSGCQVGQVGMLVQVRAGYVSLVHAVSG